MSIRLQNRKRHSPEESRALAIAAARDLLREEGIAAITLKAVAGRIGRTHANLLHHFGSVAGLHRALADDIAHAIVFLASGLARHATPPVSNTRGEQVGELVIRVALMRETT